ncbi:MAG: malate dehydrogenase [Chitinophagaceae bacterium]
MKFLTQEKLTIIGAGGMIGSNMVQTAIMMGLTPNICAYDPFGQALEGVAEEMFHCGFKGVNLTWTTDIKEALTGASFLVSSGGAARKAGMTREDLLKGNAEIAAQLGKDVKSYCPNLKQAVIVFNPADITGLIFLIHSGLKPCCVSTLAALDSTRLQSALALHFHIPQDKVTNSRTYGGHGEQMAVFSSLALVEGKPLNSLIGTPSLSLEEWEKIKHKTIQGGKNILDLRGRTSFQSPSYVSIEMVAAAMGAIPFTLPVGTYVCNDKFKHILMAMETVVDKNGVSYKEPKGNSEEMASLEKSYQHLCTMRDEVIGIGVIPSIDKWQTLNSNL